MIRVAGLSKKYRLYPSGMARLREWISPRRTSHHRDFWALHEVSLEVADGESLGIIGSNGAGKSTLLRILGGITRATAGELAIEGRVASLLELGLGFHGELSGRENIALAARFLGVGQAEIRDRLEEMIEFAELGSFIDLPIKTYSTGMFVRLGFAAAAGVDPEVLIIDEVLSVGDAYFQRKSVDRVEYFKGRGKSIVIASHVPSLLQRFCERTLWLHAGRVQMIGLTHDVVREYERFSRGRESLRLNGGERDALPAAVAVDGEAGASGRRGGLDSRWGSGEIRIERVEMTGADGWPQWHFTTGEKVSVRLRCNFTRAVENPIFGLLVHALDGTLLFATANYNIDPHDFGTVPPGAHTVEYQLDHLDLNKGAYFLTAGVFLEADHPFWSKPADYHNQMYEFRVWSDKIEHGHLNLVGRWRPAPPGSGP